MRPLFLFTPVLSWRERYVRNYVFAFCACGWGLVHTFHRYFGAGICGNYCFQKTSLWTYAANVLYLSYTPYFAMKVFFPARARKSHWQLLWTPNNTEKSGCYPATNGLFHKTDSNARARRKAQKPPPWFFSPRGTSPPNQINTDHLHYFTLIIRTSRGFSLSVGLPTVPLA